MIQTIEIEVYGLHEEEWKEKYLIKLSKKEPEVLGRVKNNKKK